MGDIFVLCESFYLLNASFLTFVQTLSVEWPVVVLCFFHDLSSVVDTPFFDCNFLVVWLLSALTSCFDAVLDRLLSVKACGLYLPVYSVGVFATLFMISFWTCGSVILSIDCCLFLLLGCS